MSELINKSSPLIISGIGRSGTSALLKALAQHSEVFKAEKIGEAPFVSNFLNFLVEYENNSPMVDYNLKNYRLSDEDRKQLFAELIIKNQCGNNIDPSEPGKKYWIAKTSLTQDEYKKANELFGEVRIVYIMRNGIEVINSARNFSGFADLSFVQLCQRWKGNIHSSEYLFDLPLVSVVKHDHLVANPVEAFSGIFGDLEITPDSSPAEFINTNLFNSSFDKTTQDEKAKESFKNRLKAWDSWSEEEQNTFIEICDDLMVKYDFVRPYDEIQTGADAGVETGVDTDVETQEESHTDVSSTEKSEENVAVIAPAQPVKPASSVDTSGRATNNKRLHPQLQGLIAGKITQSYFNYVCNVSDKYKYLFVNVPKVASTSLLGQMQLAEDSSMVEHMKNVHDRSSSPLLRLTNYSEELQNEICFGDSYKRISMVRNPFTRMLSAYLSKISTPLKGWKVDPKHPDVRPPKAEVLAKIQGKDVVDITDMSQKVSFDEFLDVVSAQSIEEMDIHWKPQHAIILSDAIEYNFIGRMENFESCFEKFNEVSGIKTMKMPSMSANHTGSIDKLSNYYRDDSIAKVREISAKDFEQFEYDPDLKIATAA